jgi:DNA-binding beta-propeller fold protein YncE
MNPATKRVVVLCLLAVGLCLTCPGSALGAASDPIFVFKPERPLDPKEKREPPPAGYLEGPCGVAASPTTGRIVISDYYHGAVDEFAIQATKKAPLTYVNQVASEDPLDGPCGLAANENGVLYVNNFHRNIVNLTTHNALPLPAEDPAHHLPTGVAIEPATNRVYVDNRTYVTVFESDGTQVMDGLEPLQIGADAKADYYGLAVSATGKVYVADATTEKVKVFDPALDKTNPVATINGPGKGFNSLRDASLAIDKASGVLYVTDNLQPTYTEEPEAAIDVYSPLNALLGVLKYKVFDAIPVGLSVDNSGGVNQGHVYVTSGNTDQAAVYAYGAGAQTSSFLPPSVGATVKIAGSGSGAVSSNTGEIDCSSSCSAEPLAGSDITLNAIADPGSSFSGWSGDCSGSAPSCTVSLDEAVSLGANFTASAPEVDVGTVGSPEGSVTTQGAQSKVSAPARHMRHPRRHRHHHRRHRAKHQH